MKKLTEEHKQKLRDSHVGMTGRKHSEETKRKMRLKHLGKKMSLEMRNKMSIIRNGTKLSEDHKKKIGDSVRGEKSILWKGGRPKCIDCGSQLSLYSAKRCNAHKGLKGENSPHWKGGITPIHQLIRQSVEYEAWRKSVLERDAYMCQQCDQIGGYLEVDHIKPFAFYPELRFELSNGRTLCKKCHRKTDTYGRRKEYYA